MIAHNKVSKYKGVSWNKTNQKWTSRVGFKGIKYECGYHETEREACLARDKKILALGMDKELQILKKRVV
jgi:hypothetical protein